MPSAHSCSCQPFSGKWISGSLLLTVLAFNATAIAAAQSQTSIEIIARSTDPVFGGDAATEARLEAAFINNAGDVAFGVNLVEIDGCADFETDVVYRYSSGALTEEARLGAGGAGGNETVTDILLAGLGNGGAGLIQVSLIEDEASSDPVEAIFLSDGSTLIEILQQGEALPGGGTLNRPLSPRINSNNQVAFLTLPPSEFFPDAVILAAAEGLQTLARSGQVAAGQSQAQYEFFTGFTPISNAGHVGFSAQLTGLGITEFANDRGFYVADPDGVVLQYARTGEPAPTEPGSTIASIDTRVPVTSDGRALLSLGFRDAGGEFSNGGLFLADGTKLEPVLLGGAPAPGIQGQFIDFPGVPSMNDQGEIAVVGFLIEDIATVNRTGQGFLNREQAIFVGDSSNLAPIVKTGDPVPGGTGEFQFFSTDNGEVGLNEKRQIVFLATVDLLDGGSEADTFGLFFHDPELGLKTIVMRDQPFDGDTLANFAFRDNAGAVGDAASGLNDVEQVAFQYLLGNGETGIAVFTNRDEDLIFRDGFERNESR